MTSSRHIYIVRIFIVFMMFVGLFAALASHLYKLMVVRHPELVAKARSRYITEKTDIGSRGLIYDVNGHPLVGNLECVDILADLTHIKEKRFDYMIDILSEELGIERDVLHERFYSGRAEVVVKNGVDLETIKRLRELRLPGLRYVDAEQRTYPKEYLLSNVLGFTKREIKDGYHLNIGQSGLEKVYNDELMPRLGKVLYERDASGKKLLPSELDNGLVLDGKSVYLTIHEPIQHIVEQELALLYEKFEPK